MNNLFEKYKGSYLSYFLMYNFYYLSWALFSSLISVYLMNKGFKASEVSLVVSTSFLTSMIAQPLIGILSDRYDVKKINMILFLLAGCGGIYFIFANSLISIIIGYSFVLTLINGTNPIMEKIATVSPYQYGKIRVWGTIGYALGSQMAGLIYDYISPSAIFICFVLTMLLCMAGLYGTCEVKKTQDVNEQVLEKGSFLSLFKNKKFLYYLIISALFFGLTNMSHTYLPAMFQDAGLQIGVVSTILSIAVLCEAPLVFFSNKFMDKIPNKKLLIIAFSMVMIQYAIYGFDLWMGLKVLITLITKHPAGMLFIMINLKVVSSLVDESYQITALAIVQTVRNLSSILFQNIAGQILDITTYQNLFLIALVVIGIGFILTLFFKVPSGNDKKLFN